MYSPTDSVTLYSRWYELTIGLLRVYCDCNSEWLVVVVLIIGVIPHLRNELCIFGKVRYFNLFAIYNSIVAQPGVVPGGPGTTAPSRKSLKIKFLLFKKYLLLIFLNMLNLSHRIKFTEQLRA